VTYAVDRRIRREPWAVEDDELEALGEWELCAPRRFSAADASVDEDDPFHRPILFE